jgi:hypothetical protein
MKGVSIQTNFSVKCEFDEIEIKILTGILEAYMLRYKSGEIQTTDRRLELLEGILLNFNKCLNNICEERCIQ